MVGWEVSSHSADSQPDWAPHLGAEWKADAVAALREMRGEEKGNN